MNPTPHTVKPETPIADAARLLHDRKLNGVLVLDAKGDMVGLLTTTNALEALIHFATAAAGGS
jgi:acetoin utilization protein AcuB